MPVKRRLRLPLYLQLRVFHIKLGLVKFRLKQAVCDSQRSVGHEQHSELELGHKFTCAKDNENRVALTFPSPFSRSKGQMWDKLCHYTHSWIRCNKLHAAPKFTPNFPQYGFTVTKTGTSVFGRTQTTSFKVALTILLLHDIEWLQQLVFGTLHHTQPGPAFIFKCPEEETQATRAQCPQHLSGGDKSVLE